MWALAGNVWSFLHRFALGTAILSGGYIAGTDGMGAFLALIRRHMVSPFIKSAKGLYVRQQRKAASALRIQTVGYSNSSRAVEVFAYIHSPLFGQDTAL
jgi:hypothetical protein